MKVNLRLVLSLLVFVAAKSDFANCSPVDLADKSSKGSSSELIKGSESTPNPKEPPLIFPKDSSVYKIVENDTALKILQARAAAETSNPTDAEGSTSNKGQNVQRQPLAAKVGGTVSNDESIAPQSSSSRTNRTLLSSTTGDKGKKGGDAAVDDDDDDYNNAEDDDDDDLVGGESPEDDTDYDAAEELQPDDPNREEGLEEQFGDKSVQYPLIFDNTTIEVSSMRQEHIWIIMVGAVFVLALAAYIAMVLYRNRLENRYGMRQRLVTEDDYYSNNEM